MTQPVPQNSGIAELRVILRNADDNALRAFIHAYSVGTIAELLISIMNEGRVEFLTAIARAYPEDWNRAVQATKE